MSDWLVWRDLSSLCAHQACLSREPKEKKLSHLVDCSKFYKCLAINDVIFGMMWRRRKPNTLPYVIMLPLHLCIHTRFVYVSRGSCPIRNSFESMINSAHSFNSKRVVIGLVLILYLWCAPIIPTVTIVTHNHNNKYEWPHNWRQPYECVGLCI